MIVNTITEAKANLSKLIELVQQGDEVIISKSGKPVAVMKAYDRFRRQRSPGALKGEITIRDDFDELPSEIAEAFGADDTKK